MSDAAIGYGSQFQISTDDGSTWLDVGEVFEITPPAATTDTPDATHMQSPNGDREFIPGLTDNGECTFTMNFIPGGDSDALVLSIKGQKVKCRVVWPTGGNWTFDGIRTSYAPAIPIDDKMTAAVGFKVSGSLVAAAAGAPVNSIKPAISGVAQVGQVLTAYPGVWSGAPSFAYQWKNEGANLSGATSQTYTLQASDSGDTITVTVTASNSEGSASATSAGLADIAA